ncbi:DUF2892 domain-containing protein [Roseococcus sp. DSY-14]|uniref:YgaP family membrane protein n=1 Tax=Roseococcus sp. DSY-14 TaxID=3369650 RepID=UPI00387AF4ED
MFEANVGGLDRVLRVAIGAALVLAAVMGWIGAWGWIGLLPLLTGLLSRCPAYSLLGVRTCGRA